MGKATGFLEYLRKNNTDVDPLERIKNYREFHLGLNEAERRRQGARCMNCGVPFCQSGMVLGGAMTGCPLHNLIPEWNDEIYNGNDSHALARLLKTNPFPEFTGRVCPALCEKACVMASFGDAVTVRENELFVIENAFENGLMKAEAPAVRTDKKVAVVGSGPSGLTVAELLNKRGHNVTVYEKDDLAGGLLTYGIPNMKLDKQVVARRIKLMEEEGVVFVCGVDVGKDITGEELTKAYDAVVLCCGSRKPRVSGAEGANVQGVIYAVDFLRQAEKYLLGTVGESDGKLACGKKVIVVGGGDTGNDCVATCLRQGAASVTQLEIMPPLPEERAASNPWPEWPRVRKTDYGQEEYIALYGSDPRIYCTEVKKVISENGIMKGAELAEVKFLDGKFTVTEGSERTVEADMLIVAAGFVGCEEYVADAFGISAERGRLCRKNYLTDNPQVFAAGDAATGQSLVVKAIADAKCCAAAVDEYLMGYTNMR